MLIPQQLLTIKEDQRFPKGPLHLPPQDMEILGGCATLNNLQISIPDLLLYRPLPINPNISKIIIH